MENKNNLMISISGIRGIVGHALTPDKIVEFTSAFARFTGAGRIVIGRDTRISGPMVNHLVIGALMASGCDVIDLGIVSTPTVEIMVKHLNATGGIVITSSHNPSEWNALKLINNKGMFLSQVQAEKVREFYENKNFKFTEYNQLGSLQLNNDANDVHIKHILSKIDVDLIKKKKFKVILDSCNGAGAVITEKLLKELGCEVIKLNCSLDKDFPRDPEPIEKNLIKTIEFVKTKKADVCFVQDPDADRLAVISGKGVFIGEEYSLVLAAMYFLEKNKGDIVVNVSTSMMIDKIAEKFGVKVFRSRVGEINVSEKMCEVAAVIGGEGNGGVICPMFHYGRDSLVGIVLILSLMAKTGKTISLLVEEIPHFIMKKEKLNLEQNKIGQYLEDIKKKFKGAKLDLTDGVKFCWEDKWVHVRASNTEPVVRVIAEAGSLQEVDELIESCVDSTRMTRI